MIKLASHGTFTPPAPAPAELLAASSTEARSSARSSVLIFRSATRPAASVMSLDFKSGGRRWQQGGREGLRIVGKNRGFVIPYENLQNGLSYGTRELSATYGSVYFYAWYHKEERQDDEYL